MKPWHKRLLIGGMTFFLIAGATAIIVPNFIPARHTNHPSCIGYLKWIEGATGQWALENQKGDADKPVLAEVIQFLPGKELPKCPKGGTYQLGAAVKDPPTCTLAKQFGHTL